MILQKVPKDEFRMYLAITVTEGSIISQPFIEKLLPAGRCAITIHRGSYSSIADTINSFVGDWLLDSGEELADFPLVLKHCNSLLEVAETELVTEVSFLLK